MTHFPVAGLFGLAALGAQAQATQFPFTRTMEPVVVTATRALTDGAPTLRDAVVITREQLDAAGPLSLAEALQRYAGIEYRATGGPGQPTGIFIRGAGAAQTLVLIDGMRAGSATAGTTAVEAIPLDMIERIEVVKGPMSSLYGADASGGVVHIFTRGKYVPHLFVSAAYGSDNDRRASAGVATAEKDTQLSLSIGARKVDAPSATNARAAFGHDPDRDPHENAFATFRATHRLWQAELLSLEVFASRSRTRFDGGDPNDRADQSVSGAKFSSSTEMLPGWTSRIAVGQGRDRLVLHGGFPGIFETRQDQASWINDFKALGGSLVAGLEALRQRVSPDVSNTGESRFVRDRRDTNSGFVSFNQSWAGQHFEASARRDDDDQFGKRNTGAMTVGAELYGMIAAVTYARGFRAPTFNDLYLEAPFYTPNPDLRPERSRSRELSLRSRAGAAPQWRVTAFDTRFEDLIVFSFAEGTPLNVNRARVRGVEASVEAVWLATRLRGAITLQRPRDEDSGKRLQSRAEHFGSLEASRAFGPFTARLAMVASGERFDSTTESAASRLPGYARVDAHLRYALGKQWNIELSAVNLADKRYESAVGYDATRRGVMLNVRFDAF